MADYNKELAELVKSVYEEYDCEYTFHEDKGIFVSGFEAEGVIDYLDQLTIIETNKIMVYFLTKSIVAENRRMEVCEYIARVNLIVTLTNLELNMDDGKLHSRSAIFASGFIPDKSVIGDAFYGGLLIFEKFGQGLVSVMLGLSSPEEAFASAYGRVEQREDK